MTTETATRSATPFGARTGSARPIVRTALLTVACGLAAAVLAGLVHGRSAALGVLVGLAIAVIVLGGGALLVDAVALVMPAASLLLALLTYTLQLLVVLLAFVALEGSGLLGASLDRAWLGGTVIAATMVWLAWQLRCFLVRRLPVFDLPAPGEGGH